MYTHLQQVKSHLITAKAIIAELDFDHASGPAQDAYTDIINAIGKINRAMDEEADKFCNECGRTFDGDNACEC